MQENFNQQAGNASTITNSPKYFGNSEQKKAMLIILCIILLIVFVGIISYYLGFKHGQTIIDGFSTPSPTISTLSPSPSVYPTQAKDLENVIYEKDEGWGPCPPGGEPCAQNTILYGSGRLVYKGNKNDEKQLSQDVINKIITEINNTDIMNKLCEAPIVLDYSATYKITVDGKQKTIRFPGCEDELKAVDKLFL